MSKTRGQRVAIGLGVVLVLVGSVVSLSWKQISTQEYYFKDDSTLVYARVHRWKREADRTASLKLETRGWSIETGMLAGEGVLGRELHTMWHPDGSIAGQYWPDYDFFRSTPPWRGNVKPRTSPCAPWVQQRVSFTTWWEQLPAELKARVQNPEEAESKGAGSQSP